MPPWKTKTMRADRDGISGMVDMVMVLDGDGAVKCCLSGNISQEDESNFVMFAASPVLKNALRDIQVLLAPGESDPERMAGLLRETCLIADKALHLLEYVPQEERTEK